MSDLTLDYAGTLVVLTCWCGMAHAVPEELRSHQMRQHNDGTRDVIGIYCPLGHQHVPAGESEVARERRARKQAEAQLVSAQDQLEAERKAHARTRKRVGNGVCPCCHRSFVNVQRHMKSQHPEYES